MCGVARKESLDCSCSNEKTSIFNCLGDGKFVIYNWTVYKGRTFDLKKYLKVIAIENNSTHEYEKMTRARPPLNCCLATAI